MLEYEKQEKIEHNFLFGVSFIDIFIRMGNSVNSDVIDCKMGRSNANDLAHLTESTYSVTSAPMMNGLKSKVIFLV